MPKSKYTPSGWLNFTFLLTTILVVILDQWSKAWIRANLAPNESIPAEGFFRLTHVKNSGAIFGLFPNHTEAMIIGASIGIVLLLFIALFASRWFPLLNTWVAKIALGLILGGTIGNLIDRVRFGYVTDFIDIGIWPTFNLADSSVVVSIIILLSYLLYLAKSGELSDGKDTYLHG